MKKNRALFVLALGCLSFALASCGSEETPQDSSNSQPSSSDPAADSSKPETRSGYRRVTALDQIEDGAQVAIAGYSGSDLYGFTSQNKPNEKDGGVYSWYFLGEKIETVNSAKDVQDLKTTALWTVEKSSDAYTFSLDGQYLSGYVDGSHYSIGLVDAPSSSTTSWTLEIASNGAVSMKSAAGTYLEYYRSSWCGYSKSAEVYLYIPGEITLDPTPSNSDSSASQNPSLPVTGDDSGWEGMNFATYGNDFRLALRSRISAYRTKTTSYSSCLEIGAQAAAYPQGSNQFVPFYHAAPGTTVGVSGDGALTTTKGACNREHAWPNSRGSGKSGPGADPFIIRPTLTKENSSRGNSFYGTGSSEWDPASCGFEGARGEAARVILYAATAYSGFELSNNPGDNASLHTMGTLKTLLDWNATYPVTGIEKQINEYLCKQGYGRNPFVDHPEYANYIWDYSGLRSSSFAPAPSTPTNSSSSNPSNPEPTPSSSTPTNKPATGTKVDLFAPCSEWAQYTKPTALAENNGVSVTFFAGNNDCSYYDGQVHCYPNGGFKVFSLWPLSEVKLTYASNPNKNNTLVTGWVLSSDSVNSSLSVEEGNHEETVSLSNAFDFSLSVRGNAGNIGVSGVEVTIA